MTSSESAALSNLERIGKLKAEAPDARERAGLLRSAADVTPSFVDELIEQTAALIAAAQALNPVSP